MGIAKIVSTRSSNTVIPESVWLNISWYSLCSGFQFWQPLIIYFLSIWRNRRDPHVLCFGERWLPWSHYICATRENWVILKSFWQEAMVYRTWTSTCSPLDSTLPVLCGIWITQKIPSSGHIVILHVLPSLKLTPKSAPWLRKVRFVCTYYIFILWDVLILKECWKTDI